MRPWGTFMVKGEVRISDTFQKRNLDEKAVFSYQKKWSR